MSKDIKKMAENKKDNWEQKTIEKIASNSLIEQRRRKALGYIL